MWAPRIFAIFCGALACALTFAPGAQANTAPPCPFSWERTLRVGSVGEDVMALQKFLNASPDTVIAESGPGSPGNETKRFGVLTAAAVKKFQAAHAAEVLVPAGLSAPTGVVGSATRAKLSALCVAAAANIGTSSTPLSSLPSSVAPVADALMVVAAEVQPEQTLAVKSALYVPFTNVTFTAGSRDVTINAVTIQRAGPANDAAFSYIEFFDEDGSGISYGRLNSESRVTLKGPLTIAAGASRTVSFLGDMASDLTEQDGQIAGLHLVAVDATSPVSGALPIRGTYQTINNSLGIGTAQLTLSPHDPNGERMQYVNDVAVRFAAVRVSAGTEEDIKINSVKWEQAGSATPSDFANVVVTADGQRYAAAVEKGKFFVAEFPGGIVIPRGMNMDIAIEGDLLPSGAGRTVRFNLYFGSDIDTVGMKYGYGIDPYPTGNTDVPGTGNSIFLTSDGTADGEIMTPFFQGSLFTVSPGAFVSVSKN